MPLVKPAPWAVSRAAVSPAYQDLWRGLISLVPLFHTRPPLQTITSPAEIRDVVRGVSPVSVNGDMVWHSDAPYGPALDFDGTGDWFEWHATEGPFAGLTELSGFLLHHFIQSDSNESIIRKNGEHNIQLDAAERLRIALWPGGTLQNPTTGAPVLTHTHWYLIGYSWRSADLRWDIYLLNLNTRTYSKVSQTIAASGALPDNASVYRWGTADTPTEENLLGKLGFGAWWNRKLTDAEFATLFADPFGLIRPATVQQTNPVASLYATADGTIADVVDEADLATGLFDSVDDDPATPTDTDWINNEVGV